MEGRGEGDSRVRCFPVGCLIEGGGGKASVDGVGVVSVDKERKGIRAVTIRRRGVCVSVDNMLKGVFKDDRELTVPAGNMPTRLRELPAASVSRLYISMSTLKYVFLQDSAP
jgi:hypothetical protein